MSSITRAWLTLEIITFYILLVNGVIGAALVVLLDAPLKIHLFPVLFIASCCLSALGMWKMSQYLFHGKTIERPTLIASFVLCWSLIWVPLGVKVSSSVSDSILYLLPILVVIHFVYLVWKSIKINS